MTSQDFPRLGVTAMILALFAYAVFAHWGTGLEETLKNIVLLAVGFWLGSSKGAQTQSDNLSKALDIAGGPPSTPDVTLKPGQTALATDGNNDKT